MLAIRDSQGKRSTSMAPTQRRDYQAPARREHDNFFSDPFSDFGSPAIFSENPFKSMARMMQDMENHAKSMFKDMDRHMESMMKMPDQYSLIPDMGLMHRKSNNFSSPQYYSNTIIQSTKYDSQGRPVFEKYQNHAYGGTDESGVRYGERKQAYKNTQTGLEKYGHERKIGDKGRKVIQERVGNQEHRSDLYKNINEEEADNFDREWEQKARNLGISNSQALPTPSGNIYGRRRIENHRNHETMNEERRGDYIPDNWRRQDQPVRYRANDIQPTIPGLRAIQAPQQAAAPLRQPPRRQNNNQRIAAVPGA